MTKAINFARALVPALSPSLHKGQAGRLGVVGGSKDYTGAPFFSAMSAMRIGVDLAHIICEPKAGDVIKTYAPDLIVHRVLAEEDSIDTIKNNIDQVVSRLHVLVVGPGLGRDDHMQACAGAAIDAAKSHNIALVLDADGLWYLNNNTDVLNGYTNAIITPNVMEMKRLCEKLNIDQSKVKPEEVAAKVSEALGGVTVLEKGSVDTISNGSQTLTVDAPGSLKRCGGQGDVLSGAAGTLLAWGSVYAQGIGSDKDIKVPHKDIQLYAAYGASAFTRECSRRTYADCGRSMITQDMLTHIAAANMVALFFLYTYSHPTFFSLHKTIMSGAARVPLNPLILCGPSGSGKSTLLSRLFGEFPNDFGFSISHTTRQPREGEVLGQSYHFVNKDVFQKLIESGSFIEHAVFSNNFYGTSAKAVAEMSKQQRRCILDIDAQGVRIIKQNHAQLQPTFVFLSPPSIDTLATRLAKRGSETDDSLRARLEAAKGELDYAATGAFDHVIVNDNIDAAYQKLRTVALGEGAVNDTLPS
ncbi:hypothetical protein E3P99_01694 [Wallemia hederae]|uniref:ATP-dependent (S)-NAD(P)H-hydrate dehydratase n=1 Tax=Wallemia hederae TaxID=1540922 RepID=A0A4T0FQG0_9BASI|nr:hypothetical protein E3P99_01694 [Wallemia hederae]